jgi:predicted amidohydrolase YtcJ
VLIFIKASLALIKGKIYTMDGRCEEAVAIADDKIIKVGKTSEVYEFIDNETEVIDLEGKTVLPGFIDTHTHLVGYGLSLNAVDLSKAKSIKEIIELGRNFVEEKQIKPGEWILGRGWNQNNFVHEKVFPTKKDLDQISMANPILFIRTCGHIGIVNSLALKESGITKDTFIEGGAFDKDENGEPNGVIREASLEWFKKNGSYKPSKASMKKAIIDGANELLKYGVTSIHTEDSYDLGYSGDFKDIYDTYQEMVANDELPIRIYP